VTVAWNSFPLSILLAYSAGYLTARWIHVRAAARLPPRSPENVSDADIMAEYHARRQIDALRLYRARYQCSLHEGQAGLQALVNAAGKS
jgi:hypothetical protein